MGLIDIMLLAVIAFFVVLAVRQIVKKRKQGGSCCGDCSGCAYPCRQNNGLQN